MTKEQLDAKRLLESLGYKHTKSWLQNTRLWLTMERHDGPIWVDMDGWIKRPDPEKPGHNLVGTVDMYINQKMETI